MLEGLRVKTVDALFRHLQYLTASWYILWPFNIFYSRLVHFPRFGMLHQEKSGNPDRYWLATIAFNHFFVPLFGAQKKTSVTEKKMSEVSAKSLCSKP
jgi:hypothetical protein